MNKTSLLGPVSIPVRRRRTLFLPGVRLRNYKVLNQKKKKNKFCPSFYNPVPIKGFFGERDCWSVIELFSHGCDYHCTFCFFSRKDYNFFHLFSSMIWFSHRFKWLHNIPFRWARSCLCRQALGICIYMLDHISDCPPRVEKDNSFGGLWVLPKMLSQE